MNNFNYINILKRMDSFIRLQNTGTAKEFAEMLGICRKSVFNYIDVLKSMGAEIYYNHSRRSYCYAKPYTIKF